VPVAEQAEMGLAPAAERPLADRMRPRSIADIVGQPQVLGPGKPLRVALESGRLHSMLLWGPPGSGKTTLARLVAQGSDAQFIALSAVMAGIAGALYVPQVGIINPSEMSPTNSIEAAIWVALGGRGTLIGPLLGAAIVNGAKSWFTVAFPEYWLFFLGLMFILVTLFLPRGVIGLLRRRRHD